MDRNDRIRQSFTKSMRLIEIGASYNPIIPKAAGWRTTIIDHAPRADLLEKYHDLPTVAANPGIIEEVDIVWRDGPLSRMFPAVDYGSYDGLVASHVAEHMPDLVAFLRSVAVLLKPSGVFFLALPDKRLCFDFFQPSSTTGDVLDGMETSRHSRGTLFDHSAYYARRNGEDSWFVGRRGGTFTLANDLESTRHLLTHDASGPYVDSHTWRFTPASFQLLILELNVLGLIPWRVATIEPQGAVEFFAWLERGRPTDAVEEQRVNLLRETIMETKEQVIQMEPEPEPSAEPRQPTISAIIPLYNGEKFIEQSLRSILAQTLRPDEIIVVDDGSTDNGAAIVRTLIDKGLPIRLLSKQNGGQASARNHGIRSSTGDLIALLDQDDAWYPHHLEELIKPFLTGSIGRELGWVYSDLDEYDSNDGMVHHCFIRRLGGQHPKTELFACLASDMFVLPSASLISRKAFEAVGGFDERLSGYEDDDLFLRLYRAGYANVFLETALSKWRIYPDSSSYSYRMRRSRAIYLRKLLDTYPDDPTRSRYLSRDLILPRFYPHAVAEFLHAVRANDKPLIEETQKELLFILSHMPGRRRQAAGFLLSRLRSPTTVRRLYSARPYLRPLIRRLI
jgi:glycosyltransferase involved in cell wall biosynthesis/SAM-dependent methyltransferase